MNDSPRVGQRLHKSAGAARVIQVNVRQKNVINRITRDAEDIQGIKQMGYRIVRADIDEGRAAGVLYDMRGCVAWM